MNVLVYNGEGASVECIKHTLELLKLHLEPFYSIQQISKEQLLNEPWYDTTKSKMLVFPGGYSTPYNELLLTNNEKVKNLILKKFKNGIFLGIGAGGYLGADSIQFDIPTQHLRVDRPLKFFPGLAQGPAFEGFNYINSNGAKVVNLAFRNEATDSLVHTKAFFNGGGNFVNADAYDNVEVIARFEDELDLKDSDGKNYPKGQAAAVFCQSEAEAKVKAVLVSPHLEYIPRILQKANESNPGRYHQSIIDGLKQDCDTRDIFWKQLFRKLGLRVNGTTKSSEFGSNLTLTPTYLHYKNKTVAEKVIPNKDYEFFQFEHDSFQVFKGYQNNQLSQLHKGIYELDAGEIPKSIVLPKDDFENKSSTDTTPFFNAQKFYSYLKPENKLANILLLTERITSSSTMLDSNPTLLRTVLGNETVCNVGAIQVQGKGRGSNAWLSPKGTLGATVSFDFPEGMHDLKVFYLQYIAAFSACDAIREYYNPFSNINNDTKEADYYGESDHSYCQIPVVIKWPNDLYILKPSYYHSHFKQSGLTLEEFIENAISGPVIDNNIFMKVGGVLLNVKYTKRWELLFGIGINCFNKNPNPCVQDWAEIIHSDYPNLPNLEMERLEARILNCLDIMLDNVQMFDNEAVMNSFLRKFYKYWLHSGQDVTLKDFNNAKCEIIGISSDYGYLEVKDKTTGKVYQLKPDGNSFNIFAGLISEKLT
ncbi:hypothetical protein ACO0SA_003220 [Hanseniaspora valbyensis]